VNDQKLEQIVGNLLRTGVILAAAVVLASGIWYLAVSGQSKPDYHIFQPVARGLHLLSVLPKPEALILIGLLLLIATPVARVVFAIVAFALEGDRLYVGFTVIVLVILLYSIGTSWL
jgi:uncharacterized membrane protein